MRPAKCWTNSQHIVKAHIPRDRAIVEEDVDVAAGVGAAVGIFEKAAVGTAGINLAAAHFCQSALVTVVASPGGDSAAPGTEPEW
jgi:hypothetical protein